MTDEDGKNRRVKRDYCIVSLEWTFGILCRKESQKERKNEMGVKDPLLILKKLSSVKKIH